MGLTPKFEVASFAWKLLAACMQSAVWTVVLWIGAGAGAGESKFKSKSKIKTKSK